MARVGDKDLSELREGPDATTQSKMNSGLLKELSGNHKIEIFWDLNEESKQDQIFILRIDNKIELYLDKQDLLRHTRFI